MCWRRNISARRACPRSLKPVPEEGVPEFLWRKHGRQDGKETTGEHSAKQVFDRLAGTWTYWGWKGGYFDGEGRRPGLL